MAMRLLCPLLFLVLAILIHAESRNILLLGGNGLLGGHAAQRLFAAGHQLTAINRGGIYWDWEQVLSNHFQRVLHCDRAKPLHRCETFVNMCNEGVQFDLVVDFSGLEPAFLLNSIEDLAGRFNHYVFVGTDSVYEVSAPKPKGVWSSEEHAVRPASPQERLRLAELNPYGEAKLRAEELLSDLARRHRFSALTLRLPDVIGPRDTTLRFWAYMATLEIGALTGQSLLLPKFAHDLPMSMVFADDVARLITQLASEPQQQLPGHVETFNLASPHTVTQSEMLHMMMEHMGLTVPLHFVQDTDALVPRYLVPTVDNGPVNTSRSEARFKFTHTPWNAVMRATVSHYQLVMDKELSTYEPWKSQVMMARLKEKLNYLQALRLFDDTVWQRFFTDRKKLRSKKDEL